MSRDIQDEKELPWFPLPLISIHLNRITPCFPHETLQLMPLESCRAGELVHGSLQTRGAITPVSIRPNSSFLPVLFFFPLNFFFCFVCAKYIPQHLHASPWTFPNSKGSRNDSKLLSVLSKECKSGNSTSKARAGKSILPTAKHFTFNIFEPASETISPAKTTFPH